MSETDASSGLKSRFSSLGWWKGVAGNLISTILGIALTIGIAGLADHQKDKRQAREMMFTIVKSAEDNVADLVQYDSLYNVEVESTLKLLIENLFGGGLSAIPSDSLNVLLHDCYCFRKYSSYRSSIESYFYSAQLMHQFSNPEIYSYFAVYVEYDKSICEEIQSLYDAASKLSQTCTSRMFQKNISTEELIAELIADGTLTDYYAYLKSMNLKKKSSGCEQFFDNMLLQMGATKEEYEKYKAKNFIVEEDRVTKLK